MQQVIILPSQTKSKSVTRRQADALKSTHDDFPASQTGGRRKTGLKSFPVTNTTRSLSEKPLNSPDQTEQQKRSLRIILQFKPKQLCTMSPSPTPPPGGFPLSSTSSLADRDPAAHQVELPHQGHDYHANHQALLAHVRGNAATV
jgi:hypothetical protein